MTMSSSLRCTACLRAWARSLLVFNSSTETRRPRSARRSMVRLLTFPNPACVLLAKPASALTAGPALPHAKFEYSEIGGLEQPARRDHDFGGGGATTLRKRQHLIARFDLRRVSLAHRGHERLQRLGAQVIAPAAGQRPLEFGGKPFRLCGTAAIGGRACRLCLSLDRFGASGALGGWSRRHCRAPCGLCRPR